MILSAVSDHRERLMNRLKEAVKGTGTFAPAAAEAELLMWLTLSDLFAIDGRAPEWNHAWYRVIGRFGASGLSVMRDWFATDEGDRLPAAQVVSVCAEF